jgi:hypothetical protein
MPLSQDQRISLSKTILSIPDQVSEIDKISNILSVNQVDLLTKDNFIKDITEPKNTLISAYHNELKYINGQDRVSLTEQDVQDAGQRIPGNYFFPANQSLPTPSVPDGVWKSFVPFVMSGGIGKTKTETYQTITNYESFDINSIISDINTFFTTYTSIIRTTGQTCISGTPPDSDVISSDPDVLAAMNSIISKILSLKNTIQLEKNAAIANTDSDSARILEKNSNISSIDTMISAIDAWLAYPDFNTAHGQTTCAGLDAYNPSLLSPTKGYDTQIQSLKSSLESRLIDATTRESQITTYLGYVVQDINTGELITTTGFYGERARIYDLRINLLTGTLNLYLSSYNSSKAIQQQKISLLNAENVYSSMLKTYKLKAPSNGTSFIHITSTSGFSIGQTIYIVSNSQPEITLTIEQINGTMIKVDKNVIQTYRPTDGARVYLDLT